MIRIKLVSKFGLSEDISVYLGSKNNEGYVTNELLSAS
jgi:hypothetical protein